MSNMFCTVSTPPPSYLFKYTISTLLLWQASLVVVGRHNEFKRWLTVSSKDFKKLS